MAKVEIILKDFIKPSSPTSLHLKHHKLSFIDSFPTPIYIPCILFYQNNPSFDPSQISHQLKNSLSFTLTKYYPLAGRIQDDIFVDCEDSGAPYIEARVHTSLADATQNFVIEEFNRYLPINPYESLGQILKSTVPLAVQVSFFECGSIAIGICISHRVADTLSAVMFLNSWAAICKSNDDNEILKPNLDLGCLYFPPPKDVLPSAPLRSVVKKEKVVAKRLVFDKEKLEKLKEVASSVSDSPVKDPTRVEALSAYICKNFIDVNQAKVDARLGFVALHAVNLRPKIKLPNTEFAFGNISFPISALLRPDTERECHDIVGHLRNAIRSVNDDFVKNVVQEREPYLRIMSETREVLAREDVCFCNFTSWCRFPIYEVDYGWGKPFFVGTAAVPAKNTIILMSTKCGDGIEAWVNLAEEDIGMLSREFLSLVNHNL
ncbi:hypothetical protein ACH5RR_025309 [Cinchona calisaya]|uniref:Uncharacterized protein n=1 Tax=Cinchona calisaya TaxID=153742 RepID=A0ABD2YZ93_9GENT